MTDIILDEEMGAAPFVIYREHKELVDGEAEDDGVEEIVTSGVVQPTREAELELVPQEYRHEALCSFYSPVAFSLGSRDGDTRYTAPARAQLAGGSGGRTVVNHSVAAPVNIHVTSTAAPAESVGQYIYDTAQRSLLKTLEGVFI